MTDHALNASALAALNRRGFLKAAGTLVVSFALTGRGAHAQFGATPIPGSPDNRQLDSWLAVAADGSITAYSGKEELGQGISTAQQQLVAEELSVAFDRVNLLYCDTALTPDQAYTSGSQSHPTNFRHGNLALACATAREALVDMASQRLGIPPDQLRVTDGVISGRGQQVSYGELVGGRKLNLDIEHGCETQRPRRMDSARKASRPSRYGIHGYRAVRVRP